MRKIPQARSAKQICGRDRCARSSMAGYLAYGCQLPGANPFEVNPASLFEGGHYDYVLRSQGSNSAALCQCRHKMETRGGRKVEEPTATKYLRVRSFLAKFSASQLAGQKLEGTVRHKFEDTAFFLSDIYAYYGEVSCHPAKDRALCSLALSYASRRTSQDTARPYLAFPTSNGVAAS